MIYLILAMLCSSAIALVFKYSESNGMNRYVVTTVNYIVAASISLVIAVSMDVSIKLYGLNDFFIELSRLDGGILSLKGSFYWAIIVGVFGGIFFFLSFIYYQISVRECGATLAGSVGKLGIFVPIVLSLILWKEKLLFMQAVGMLLACVSIIIATIKGEDKENSQVKHQLLLLFLFGGLAEFSNKIYQRIGMVEIKSYFLFVIFTTAFLISIVFTYMKDRRISKKDIAVGICVGVPNMFSSFFLISALSSIKASIAFPVYSAGTIVIISILSVIIFNERLEKKDMIAIILTMASLILVNIA